MRALVLLLVPACTLGGTGRPSGGDDDGHPVDKSACQKAMAAAPMASVGFDFHDALQNAMRNRWDGTSMPQPGDAMYPCGRYRSLVADSTGMSHPGCSTAGLSYTAATIPGFNCAAREFPFPAGI